MKVHPIKIDFHVTKDIIRFVYVYLIEGESCYLIDSGVGGSEKQIEEYFESVGRSIMDLKGIFLTHAHPDHIGTAYYFREKTKCKIYASSLEAAWIEDIDLQFSQRQIPNFYTLANHSCPIDCLLKDGDVLPLEENMVLEVVETAGHSIEELSYKINDCFFIGDSVPLQDDIPIWIDVKKSEESLDKISKVEGVKWYFPAWDEVYSKEEMFIKVKEAKQLMAMLEESIEKGISHSIDEIVDFVCKDLQKPFLCTNPLFKRTILSFLKGKMMI